MTAPPLDSVLAATAVARIGTGLSHASLTEFCTRPPGTPPSQCRGSLAYTGGAADAAQAGEGEVGDDVVINLYRCDHCRSILVVALATDGTWRLRNEYSDSGQWSVDSGQPRQGPLPPSDH